MQASNSSQQDVTFSSICKDYEVFEQSYLALEYILLKCIGENSNQIIQEIFLPGQHLGGGEEISPEEFDHRIEGGDTDFLMNDPIFYLPPEKIVNLNSLIKTISATDITKHYNSVELNNNGIYPGVWHNDEGPAKAFNVRHLTADLHNLKAIIEKAIIENDYLLSVLGY